MVLCPLCAKSGPCRRLLDDFVRARKKARGHFETESSSRLKIEGQFVLGRCLYRKVSWFLALEDAIYVDGCGTKPTDLVRAIRNEPSVFNEVASGIHSGQPMVRRKSYQ